MFRAVQRWWSHRQAPPSAALIVEGEIIETGTHQPHTHLGPSSAPPEAYFSLKITKARRSDGSPESVDSVVPAEFCGPLGLLDRFSTGDRVCITTTTATGRQIQSVEPLEPPSSS